MKFFRCNCSSHALSVEYDKEYDEFSFAYWHIWCVGHSLRDKLRRCWHVLKTGKPFGDMVEMNSSQVKELISYLSEKVKKEEG